MLRVDGGIDDDFPLGNVDNGEWSDCETSGDDMIHGCYSLFGSRWFAVISCIDYEGCVVSSDKSTGFVMYKNGVLQKLEIAGFILSLMEIPVVQD